MNNLRIETQSAASCPSVTWAILMNASLQTFRSNGTLRLLTEDDMHLAKNAPVDKIQDVTCLRPDIVHMSLLALLDSPLNKKGHLKIAIVTSDNKYILVSPTFRIPRTWKVFAKVMIDFLSDPKGKLQPEGVESPLLTLLQPESFFKLLPSHPKILHVTPDGEPVILRDLLDQLQDEEMLIFAISAIFSKVSSSNTLQSIPEPSTPLPSPLSTSSISTKPSFLEACKPSNVYPIRISQYPITATVACSRVVHEMEWLLTKSMLAPSS